MEDLIAALGERVVLFDGAMGTMLLGRGLPLGTPPERWVLDRPDEVQAVHEAYVAAGAQVLATCTFGANRVHLARAGLAEHRRTIWNVAVEIARAAAGRGRWVLGDIGPIWPPVGEASAHGEQASALAAAGCDGVLLETMTDLDEAALAIAAIRDQTPLPIVASVAFVPATPHRPAIRRALAAHRLVRAGASAVGANCVLTASELLPQILQLVAATDAPVIARPNAGQPRRGAGERFIYDETPERFARGIVALAAAGARGVGGCCGTTPEMLAAAATAISSWRAGA